MAFYDSIAPWYDYIFPAAPAQVEFIEKRMGHLSNCKVADVGCGTGNLSIQLAHKGASVTGLDLDDEMLKLARLKSNAMENLDFVCADMLQLSGLFEPNSLDAVVCFGNTLVHLLRPGDVHSFFRQCKTVLKPGGWLLFQIINYDYVLDEGIMGLPSIDNEHICFEREYELREQDELINFKTKLTVKESNQVIRNVATLQPLRKDLLMQLLADTGYGERHFFGSFKQTPLLPTSTALVAEVIPDLT
jgi:2-polyprenyl-3-methyl-5-hydroxy-6-metoxy-1,4-benzoquinol methylase